MSLELLGEPWQMVDEISALGLRHVGYGIPTDSGRYGLSGHKARCAIKINKLNTVYVWYVFVFFVVCSCFSCCSCFCCCYFSCSVFYRSIITYEASKDLLIWLDTQNSRSDPVQHLTRWVSWESHFLTIASKHRCLGTTESPFSYERHGMGRRWTMLLIVTKDDMDTQTFCHRTISTMRDGPTTNPRRSVKLCQTGFCLDSTCYGLKNDRKFNSADFGRFRPFYVGSKASNVAHNWPFFYILLYFFIGTLHLCYEKHDLSIAWYGWQPGVFVRKCFRPLSKLQWTPWRDMSPIKPPCKPLVPWAERTGSCVAKENTLSDCSWWFCEHNFFYPNN